MSRSRLARTCLTKRARLSLKVGQRRQVAELELHVMIPAADVLGAARLFDAYGLPILTSGAWPQLRHFTTLLPT